MTEQLVPLWRIAALTVAIALFATPIASAQSLDAGPSIAGGAGTTLLSPGAFARLAHPPPADAAPKPVVSDWPRPSLLRQGAMAMARQAQAAPAKVPQQKSWASRHKVALIVCGAIAGGLALLYVGMGARD